MLSQGCNTSLSQKLPFPVIEYRDKNVEKCVDRVVIIFCRINLRWNLTFNTSCIEKEQGMTSLGETGGAAWKTLVLE